MSDVSDDGSSDDGADESVSRERRRGPRRRVRSCAAVRKGLIATEALKKNT